MQRQSVDALETAVQWRQNGDEVALATVIETWGSAPRKAGAHLAINANGDFMGSVSGGCVEAEVIAQALDVLKSGHSTVLEFEVADQTAWKVGLSCGGTIKILVECVK
ncbi:XdhC family protein [Bartonella sp. LJL80]